MRFRLRRRTRTIWAAPACLEAARALATQALPSETGGILLGHRVGKDVAVERLVEVIDTHANAASYRREHALAERALSSVLARESESSLLGYVGEWHTHPGPTEASSLDLRELRSIARASDQPIALVVLMRTSGLWTYRGWVAHGRGSRRAQVLESSKLGEKKNRRR